MQGGTDESNNNDENNNDNMSSSKAAKKPTPCNPTQLTHSQSTFTPGQTRWTLSSWQQTACPPQSPPICSAVLQFLMASPAAWNRGSLVKAKSEPWLSAWHAMGHIFQGRRGKARLAQIATDGWTALSLKPSSPGLEVHIHGKLSAQPAACQAAPLA